MGFRTSQNFEVTEVPAIGHIFHDSDSERCTKVASKKYCIFTHFPTDRNCEVCLRTEMTRALCRNRTGDQVRWADKFGDLIKANHKVING